MKTYLTILMLLASIYSKGQITLEHTYPSALNSREGIQVIKLSSSGYKYLFYDSLSMSMFNLDHSLFKTIVFPTRATYLNGNSFFLFNVSEELFDNDPSDIEYLVSYMNENYISNVRIYDEFGDSLLVADSTEFARSFSQVNPIVYTSTGLKMILWNYMGGQQIYSLPGTLTCSECSNGIVSSMGVSNSDAPKNKLYNYPNPVSNETTIEYSLPPGKISGDLIVYNMKGQIKKSLSVSHSYHEIILSTNDFESGTYYYQIKGADFVLTGKKLIVVK